MISLLIGHLLESTGFAALMGLLTLGFANNRASLRYGLWFAASVKFLIPFSLVAAAGQWLRWKTAPAVTLDLPRLMSKAVPDAALPARLADAVHTHAAYVAAPLAQLTAAPATIVHGASGPDLATKLLALWITGSVFLLCRWTIQGLRLRAVRKASTPAMNLPLTDLPIPARFSRMLFEPGLVGIFRPVLLLPEGIAAQLSPAQLAFVIEHELCHWRRRDNLTAAVHMAVQLAFWFHPFVWWIGARLVTERERACDESVLATCGTPQAYADSILEVCRFYLRSPLACAPGIAGANLTHRVERIMNNVSAIRLSPPKRILLAAVAAGALALPLASGLLTPSAAAALTQPDLPNVPTQPKPAPALKAARAKPPTQSALKKARLPVQLAARRPDPQPAAVAGLTDAAGVAEAKPVEDSVAANTSPAETAPPAPPMARPMEEVVVTAKAVRDFVRTRNFVRNYTAPSSFLDQISRWQSPLCVKTQGLAPGFNAFVTARIKDVAAEIGAPTFASEPCEANLNVIFTNDPQAYVDDIKTRSPALLGVHYPALLKKISTMTHPIQAWYATGTRDSRGAYHFDAYDGFYIPVFMVPGSHIDTGLTSTFAAVTIVADINKIQGREIGTVADYIAMAAFARAKSPDRCQQMPSVANALDNCSDAVKAKALSDYDVAYLKALYTSSGNRPRSLQESEIGATMLKILEKQVAAQKAAKDSVAR